MPDYSKGKIYAIRSYQTDYIYIGSTIQSLSVRLGEHKKDYTYYLNNKRSYLTSYELMKYDDYYIELIEVCPCNSKEELHRKEGELIRSMKCVNKIIAGRTKKEYREQQKESIKEYGKKYREHNQEKIKEKIKEYQEQNKEKIKEYREQNKEKMKEYKKIYREQNKEKIKEYSKKYKAKQGIFLQ